MKFKFLNFKLFFILVFLFGIFSLAKSSRAATVIASDCTAKGVADAIASASEGDTIIVKGDAPCTATWDKGLTITKGITLRGGGAGITVIAASLGNDAFLISYNPPIPKTIPLLY